MGKLTSFVSLNICLQPSIAAYNYLHLFIFRGYGV